MRKLSKRWECRLIALVCFVLLALPPAVAYAFVQVQYALGTSGPGTLKHSDGYARREWNRVWHQPGYFWSVYYKDTSGNVSGFWQDNVNPTVSNAGISYGMAWCYNYTDDSTVTWACQTTKP
jgi:hypothetical protein